MRLLTTLIGAALMLAPLDCAQALDGTEFIVPDNEGYGIAECMKPGMECGRVIADAWCESHGHGHAEAFGSTEDVTGRIKISAAAIPGPAPGSILIRCGD